MPKQVGLRFEDADFNRFSALAKADDRKLAAYMKRVLLKQLPILESQQNTAILNEPQSFSVSAKKPKPPIHKKFRN